MRNPFEIPVGDEQEAGAERELSREELDRQDAVDNACYALLVELAKGSDLPWDIEDISAVREAVQSVLVEKRHIMSEMEFYPYIGGACQAGLTAPFEECQDCQFFGNNSDSLPKCSGRG